MKKNLLAICVSVAAFSLSACSDNDKEYYLNHISEAESKLQQCNADAKEALQNKDRDALNKIKQDVECQAASAAVKEHRTAEAKRQREEEQAKRQAALDEAKKKLNDEIGARSQINSSNINVSLITTIIEIIQNVRRYTLCNMKKRNKATLK